MGYGLNVSNFVSVGITLQPAPAQLPTLNVGAVIGGSNVIDVGQRIDFFDGIDEVGAAGFSTTSPEYLAAELYFEQDPQPQTLVIGRWAKSNTAGTLIGAPVAPPYTGIGAWATLSEASVDFTIDGTARNLSAMDFTSQTSLNGVASVITSALSSHGTMTFNGTNFVLTSATSGSGAAASATVTFTANVSADDTLVINGQSLEFVASPSGAEVGIGGTAAETAVLLLEFLQNPANLVSYPDLAVCTYSLSTSPTLALTITYDAIGVAGNAITLTASSSSLTLTGSGHLAGGAAPSTVAFATSGATEDIAGALGMLASSSGVRSIPGAAAETPVACVQALIDQFGTQFFAFAFADSSAVPYSSPNGSTISDAQHIAVFNLIQADQGHFYGATTQEGGCITLGDTSNLAYQAKQLGIQFGAVQYSSQNPYAVVSALARGVTVNYDGSNTTITFAWKQMPGVVPEALSQTQYQALQSFNCNAYVSVNNGTQIYWPGITPSGLFMDSLFNVVWFRDDLQNEVYNLNYESTTKIPQDDDGSHQVLTVLTGVCQQAVANAYLAPGQWNAGGFGALSEGDYLQKGYYIYAPPIASQTQAARSARESVPFQIAAKEAGALHQCNILVTVNQ